jgi:hypothetical protein
VITWRIEHITRLILPHTIRMSTKLWYVDVWYIKVGVLECEMYGKCWLTAMYVPDPRNVSIYRRRGWSTTNSDKAKRVPPAVLHTITPVSS